MNTIRILRTGALAISMLIVPCAPLQAKTAMVASPKTAKALPAWMDTSLSPDQRATMVEKEMTQDERFTLLSGLPGFSMGAVTKPEGALGSAGMVPGIPRLGIPALQESDAGLGVTNPRNSRPDDWATALPSGLATAAGFDPSGAYDGGAMIGQEAWRRGFNVLLAGGVNLAREPRNGRNFEYLGEDPLLAGTLAGASIRGIQDQHVISTVKHYALNDQETVRHFANVVIDEAAMRESDLLAFQIAIEGGKPGSVMCSYNLINGEWGCGNKHLLTDILKTDWNWPGFVMSDWGAVHDVSFATAGLDQQSAAPMDAEPFFGQPLKNELAKGALSAERLSDMNRRILRSMFAVGVVDHPPARSAVDLQADGDVAQRIAESSIVLLKNRNSLLPLAASAKKIAVIGTYAANGVLSGGGSSQVVPSSEVITIPMSGAGISPFRTKVIHPSSPMKAIATLTPDAKIRYDDGRYPSSAVKLAKWADVVIVFAGQWMTEGEDAPDLTLPDGQDALIAAVATANRNAIVVLETGGPIQMPWLDKVGAVLEAWYPGGRGGEAIANVLTGRVNPSGRLPITFPKDISQTPRPLIPGSDYFEPPRIPGTRRTIPAPIDVVYSEGSDVGYRWFAKKSLEPLFPFGFGLSYTTFDYSNLKVEGGKTLIVSFDVTNTGKLAGADVPQVYLKTASGSPQLRLIGFSKVSLQPGQTHTVIVSADSRLLAHYDYVAPGWRIKAGEFGVAIGRSASDHVLNGTATLQESLLKP